MYNKILHAIKGVIKTTILLPFDCLFERDKNKVIFVVRQNTYYSGNLRVVCEHLIKNKKLNIYVYKSEKCKPEIKKSLEEKGVVVLDCFTPDTIYHLLTAKFFILSHSPLNAHISRACTKRVVINLWHGVAIKGIELLMPNISPDRRKKMERNKTLINHMVASSHADQDINARSFGLPIEKVHITGLPRYDLLENDYKLDNYLIEQETQIRNLKGNKKLILYAPTFRDNSSSPLIQITEDEWQEIETFLIRTNSILGIRTHPYDRSIPSYLEHNKNFVFLDNDNFTEPSLVLKATDILIVDFSSIWVDYLILNRPILGYAKDFEHYLNNERGFVYDFNQVFPSDFSFSIEGLLLKLNTLFLDQNFSIEYKKQKDLLVNYQGGKAIDNFDHMIWNKL